jgi:hypothetical protein
MDDNIFLIGIYFQPSFGPFVGCFVMKVICFVRSNLSIIVCLIYTINIISHVLDIDMTI